MKVVLIGNAKLKRYASILCVNSNICLPVELFSGKINFIRYSMVAKKDQERIQGIEQSSIIMIKLHN